MIKQNAVDWEYIESYLDQVMEYEDISAKRERLEQIRNSLKK